MGGIANLLDKMPGMGGVAKQAAEAAGDKNFRQMEAIINSMTPQERRFPDLIKASRKRRIAAGAGMEVQEVNKLLRQFDQTREMMKKLAGGGMAKLMRGLAGRLPPGMMR